MLLNVCTKSGDGILLVAWKACNIWCTKSKSYFIWSAISKHSAKVITPQKSLCKGRLTNACGLGGLLKIHSKLFELLLTIACIILKLCFFFVWATQTQTFLKSET
uniref:Uncharacterized protein n=1 Tax=Glarea lozoyensis TaxID=101852 RepID=A0A1C9M3L7_GLALO|nr:hypothetical protein [Glarea lozoyensis]AOQ30910.1 hypothetical protein [Glarea lozoyensis]